MQEPRYTACLIGCGRMGATIDDEVRERPDSFRWLPYSHAAAVAAVDRLELVAVADIDGEKAEAARARYGVPRAYSDYQEMLAQERPDVACIATRPGNRGEIVRCAAEQGVRAIYCEKPLCCSLEEADAIVAACERSRIAFNYGTQRRYIPLFRRVRELIEAGGIGRLQAVVACCGSGGALWTHTHTADMLLFQAGDPEVEFVQGLLGVNERDWEGERLTIDPGIRMGFAHFASGVHGYIVATPGDEYEARGSDGAIRILNGGAGVEWRRAREPWRLLEPEPFPEGPQGSGTVAGLLELVAALDGEGEPSGGARTARAGLELLFGLVESHRAGGRRVSLPLENRQVSIRPNGW